MQCLRIYATAFIILIFMWPTKPNYLYGQSRGPNHNISNHNIRMGGKALLCVSSSHNGIIVYFFLSMIKKESRVIISTKFINEVKMNFPAGSQNN